MNIKRLKDIFKCINCGHVIEDGEKVTALPMLSEKQFHLCDQEKQVYGLILWVGFEDEMSTEDTVIEAAEKIVRG